MLEYHERNIGYEQEPPIEHWRYVSAGSVYALGALEDNRYLIGGSTWDRRNSPFDEATRNSQGVLTEIRRADIVFIEERQLLFPSMVNAVIPLGDTVFVGCKSAPQAFNLVNRDLEPVKSADDPLGNGVYDAMFHPQTGSIVATTRGGWLMRINPSNLAVERSMPLSGCASRLWSLAADEEGVIFAGDYHGRLYMVDPGMTRARIVDLPLLLDDHFPGEQRRYDPSVFGIVALGDNRVVASIRWGQLYMFEYAKDKLRLVTALTLPEEISDLGIIPHSDDILVGTRSGTLYRTQVQEESGARPLLAIPPSYQSDNAVWSISHTETGEHIVAFADGQVVSIGIGD